MRRASSRLAAALGVMAAALGLAHAAPLLPARAVAPDFRVRSVTGEALELSVVRSRGPVLLDFWATWCRPCLAALPEIESLHRRYSSRGLTVIGVSIDGPRNYTKVRPFAARLGLTYPIVLDQEGRLQESFGVIAAPTAILVDSTGTVALATQGYRPGDGARLEAAILRLLRPVWTVADSGAAGADSGVTPARP